MPMDFYTEWRTPVNGDEPDPERHAAYEAFAIQVAANALPWLLPLLDECNAKVIAGTGLFCFELPSAPGAWLDVPEVKGRLNFLPWAEAQETSH